MSKQHTPVAAIMNMIDDYAEEWHRSWAPGGNDKTADARQAVVEALEALFARVVSGETVADRLDAMADQIEPGSQASSDLRAAATIWRKHLRGPIAATAQAAKEDGRE